MNTRFSLTTLPASATADAAISRNKHIAFLYADFISLSPCQEEFGRAPHCVQGLHGTGCDDGL
jgi:hypothetical protein